MHSQEFKAQRWMRLDFLRFWFVESWAPATVGVAASGKEEEGLQISFKMLADFRQKLQHDQEVSGPVLSFYYALSRWHCLRNQGVLTRHLTNAYAQCRSGSDGFGFWWTAGKF